MEKIESSSDFEKYEKKNELIVIHFMADWAPQCKQMNEVVNELIANNIKNVIFASVMAEDVPEVSLKCKIIAVPTFIFLKDGQLVDRLDGANAPQLVTKVNSLAAKYGNDVAPVKPENIIKPEKEDVISRIKKLLTMKKAMLFMKGSPDAPRCGFSKTTVGILAKYNADYGYFDILGDEELRQKLKEYSDWPTYPQLYIDQELIGGLDIIKEMDESGDLGDILPKLVSIDDRLKSLINKAPIMVFMKGNKEQPRCKFSKEFTGIFSELNVPYETFDILSDEEVRQELKRYSNWPTYPQIYVKGELIGGLDIIKEMKSDGSLKDALNLS